MRILSIWKLMLLMLWVRAVYFIQRQLHITGPRRVPELRDVYTCIGSNARYARTSNLHTPGDFTSSILLYIKLFSLGERSIDNVHPSINSKSKQQKRCPPSINAWPSNHTETLQHKERRAVALHWSLTFFFTFFPVDYIQIVGVNE